MAMNPRLLRPTRTASAATDPYWSQVSLLLHFDGANGSTAFTDSSSNALTVTANGNAQISTAQSKFGGASGLFDGDGDYAELTSPSSAIGQISGDFTIECWVRWNAVPPGDGNGLERQIIGQHDWPESASDGWWVLFGVSSGLFFYVSGDDAVQATTSSVFAWETDRWYHIAVVRSGGNVRLYVDGLQTGDAVAAGQVLLANDSRPLTIGGDVSGNATPMNAYIDELRITKGVARYTAAFTPPDAAFPNG